MLVERIGVRGDLDPFAATGNDRRDRRSRCHHPHIVLDGRVQGSDAVFEAKFMLPWSFSEEAAAQKYMPQLQHLIHRSAGCWICFWISVMTWPGIGFVPASVQILGGKAELSLSRAPLFHWRLRCPDYHG